jgi:hypothetical protein
MSRPPTYPKFEMPQPQVAAHAGQIADVVLYLYDHLPEVPSAVPSLMIEGALALELYLKSLNSKTVSHPLEGVAGYQLTAAPVKRGHLLEELYDTIDQPIRDELQQAYAATSPRVPLLRDALLPYSNLFVEMRYTFEPRDGGGSSITALVELVRFFHQHVSGMPRRFRIEAEARPESAGIERGVIDNLQARTDAKLRYAEVQLADIEHMARRGGDDFERSHQEAFLYHLVGAVDAFLAEINCYYRCGLATDGISPGKLREVITKRMGRNAPELSELRAIESFRGTWLAHAKVMRDHSTHRGGVPRAIHVGGELDGVNFLKNPETGEVIEEDYPVVLRRWHTEAAEIVRRLRSTAVAQMTVSA